MSQQLKPISDDTQGNWKNEDEGTELYSHIDEDTPDDSDFVYLNTQVS